MSIAEAMIQEMQVQRHRELAGDHHNAITSTEVEMKFERVMSEIKALESYVACFEREWGVDLRSTRGSLSAYRSKIDDEKIHFVNKTYMMGR